MSQAIDLAVLQAEPLVWRNGGEIHPVSSLDFATERERLRNTFAEAGVAVSVRFEAATTDLLRTVTTLGTRALHYSGHGEPGFLAFEDGRGGTHSVVPRTLRSLLEAGERKVRLVVVSACHSRKAGQAFVKAGVPHVVAIRLEEPVFDDAAREFARAFYLALLRGQTVAQAFAIGRAQVEALPGLTDGKKEKEKFLLLPPRADHAEAVFPELPEGSWSDETPETPPVHLPSLPESFLGREIEIGEVVERVLRHRLTTLRGAPGIGKTALAIVSAHYLGERRAFRDGLLFVALRNAPSPEAARVEIARHLGILVPDDDSFFEHLRPLRLLLVLDNCEDVLHAAAGPFRDFLARLLAAAPDVRILATSRRLIGALPAAGVSEIGFDVGRLAPLDAARLFVARCPRDLTRAEIGNPKPGQELRALAGHRAVHFVAGHPLAIGLAAPILADRTLDQLADLLEQTPGSTLAVPGLPEKDRNANLAATFEVSIRQVREIDPLAVRLFSAMGLLPGGAFPADLDAIWGGSSWHPQMDLLIQRASLVQLERSADETERYSTFPFVTAHAEALLTADDRRELGLRALEHFAELSQRFYEDFGTENTLRARKLFTLQEPNLRACADEHRPRPVAAIDPLRASGLTKLACYLPQLLLLFEDRLADTRSTAELLTKACREVDDSRGEAHTRKALGDLALRTDDLDAARDDYRAALEIFRQIGDRLGEAHARRALGDLALRTDDLNTARDDYRAALELFRQIGARLGEAYARKGLGNLALRTADLDAARDDFLAAIELFRQIGDRFGEAHARKALGDLALRTADFDAARDDYRTAFELFRQIGDRFGEAHARKALRDLALRTDDLATARNDFRAAFELSRQIGDRLGEAYARKALGDLALRTYDLDAARHDYRAALELFRQIRDRLGEACAHRALGDLALRTDDLATARENDSTALELFRQIGDRLGEANARKSLGDLALRTDDLDAARNDDYAALELFRQAGDRLGEANARQSLGDLALRTNNLAGARDDYRAALELFRQIRDRVGEANVLMRLGTLQLRQDDWESAIEYYETALPIFRTIGSKLGAASTLKDLGRALFESGHQARGIAAVEEAAQLYVEAQCPAWAGRASRLLAEMFEVSGRSVEAAGIRARFE